jgi:hypothetical protein
MRDCKHDTAHFTGDHYSVGSGQGAHLVTSPCFQVYIDMTLLSTFQGAVFVYGVGRYTGLGVTCNIAEPALLRLLCGKNVCRYSTRNSWVHSAWQVKRIAAGAAHTAALTTNEELYTWGKAQAPDGNDQLSCKVMSDDDFCSLVPRLTCPDCVSTRLESCQGRVRTSLYNFISLLL